MVPSTIRNNPYEKWRRNENNNHISFLGDEKFLLVDLLSMSEPSIGCYMLVKSFSELEYNGFVWDCFSVTQNYF